MSPIHPKSAIFHQKEQEAHRLQVLIVMLRIEPTGLSPRWSAANRHEMFGGFLCAQREEAAAISEAVPDKLPVRVLA